MPAIFLPGPFAEPDVLRTLFGAPPPALGAAALPGHDLRAGLARAWLALVAEPSGAAQGVVVEVDAAMAARLAFAFAAFGAGPRPTAVVTAAGAAVWAHVAAAPPAAGSRSVGGGDVDPEGRAHLAEATEEVMAEFGRTPPEAMPALMQGIGYRALARVRGRADAAPVRARRGYSAADVEAVGIERPYARYFAVEAHRLRHRRFDGRMSGTIERAAFASGDAVTLLPFDPRRRAVLLIEQFRVGPFARRDPRPWCLEAVAGRCDPGESPETTARREAREEAGLTIGRIERIAGYYTSPGAMTEHITAFVGEADLGGAGGVHGLAEEDEDIRALVLPLVEALELVSAGEVNNGQLIVSLLWLGGEAGRLAREWAR